VEGAAVRKAVPDDEKQIAVALAKAFYDDPLMTWVSPDDDRRLERLERSFRLFYRRLYSPRDETYTTEDVVGAAAWFPPERVKLGVAERIRATPGLVAGFGRDLARFLRFVSLADSKHPKERHYYLPVVGVEPGSQGRGIGTALLRPVLERCDSEGIPAYLEATSPRNRACYLRNGFEDMEEVTLPKGGPPMWLMWREPGGR
jgi:GNAT superfamily N-acetyltransferase